MHDRERVQRASPACGAPAKTPSETMRASLAHRETPAAAARAILQHQLAVAGAVEERGADRVLDGHWFAGSLGHRGFLLLDFGHATSVAGQRHLAKLCGPGECGVTLRSMLDREQTEGGRVPRSGVGAVGK